MLVKGETIVYFQVVNLYYRVIVVFTKKMTLFLLTPVSNKFLSMFSWITDCKFLQRISKAHRLRVKMFNFFKYLKVSMDKYVFHS
jgi:hypothetical protein